MALCPICVDLDGTLIRSDVTKIAVRKYLLRNTWNCFRIIAWLCKGIAYCKYRLAQVVDIDPAVLDYNEEFLAFIKEKKAEGHQLFLVTGCNKIYAEQIADYLCIFTGVMASDDKVNLRGTTKADTLCLLFGKDGFVYAGNSSQDVPVWDFCKEAVLVAPTKSALEKMRGKKYRLFE